MRRGVLSRSVPWILAIAGIALLGCGGGGGGGTPPIATATIQGSVSGTIIMAIDETGKIAAKDDTAGKTPVNGKYPFTLTVPVGHQYTIQFIVTDNVTGVETVVPLYQGTINIFSVASSGTLDLGFVDTSATTAASDNNILTQPGVTSGGTTPPPTIKLQGYRYLYTRNGPTGVVTAKFHVEVRDPGGTTPVTDPSLVKDVKIYDNTWMELPLNGNYIFWNGTNVYFDTTGTIGSLPMADLEGVLQAAASSLAEGFYNVVVTDNAGNLHNAKVYFRQPDAVAKPTNLHQTINLDNSITLAWDNPDLTGAPGAKYAIYLIVYSDDLNGDEVVDNHLHVRRNTPMNTYTIPAEFVTSQLAGKSGLKWVIQVRQYDNTIVFPDGTSQGNNTQFYRNYSAESPLTLPVPPVAGNFSQADLTGTWDLIQFKTSSQAPGGGWFRVVVRFDGSGHLIVDDNTTFQSTVADDFVPNGDSGMVWTVDSVGVITETGDPTTSAFHGTMASNKHLIIATLNMGSTDKAIRVLRKRGVPGVAYGSADLANKTFTGHSLDSGTDNTWAYVSGTTDGSGLITITSRVFPSGPVPPPYSSPGTFSVSSAGIVTASGVDSTFYGLMTDDKKVIFYIVTTDINSYEFGVITITGQTYTQSDYEGTFNFFGIRNTVPNPFWVYGVTSIDAAGNGTYLSYTDSLGSATPSGYFRVLSATGVVTDPADATSHGQLSYNKDISVRTNTNASGRYGLTIGFK
jgi:hypothetical protein